MGIFTDQQHDRVVGEGQLLFLETVCFHGLRDEEVAGDLQLLDFGIAWHLDDLHPVAQGRWDGIEHVGGRDKDDL